MLAVASEAIKFTGRTRLIILGDQENAVKNLVDITETAEHMKLPSSTHRKNRVPVQEESSEQTTRSRDRSEH